MIPIRHSPDRHKNPALEKVDARPDETNREWMDRAEVDEGVILLGGTSLVDFRIRVAQSHLRSDLLPSFWSIVGLLVTPRHFLTVPLDRLADASAVPGTNGVVECAMRDYDDPDAYPNIAVVRFSENLDALEDTIRAVRSQRAVVDLPDLVIAWLGHLWAAGEEGNPLLAGRGLPGAAFTETVMGISGIELTPGLTSASSCPEAIWQAAKWWRTFYEGVSEAGGAPGRRPGEMTATVPRGSYAVRQVRAAASG